MLNISKRTMNRFEKTVTLILIFVMAGCNMPAASTPTPDLFATLQASTPLTVSTPELLETSQPSSGVNLISTFTPTALPVDGAQPASPSDGLTGHIVFTCQIFKVQASNQICIINADGSGFRRLTTDNSKQHFYPSLAPDGRSVFYSAFYETNNYELYELKLEDGSVNRITNTGVVETAPELSPNGEQLAYARYNSNTERFQLYISERNGNNAGNIAGVSGWDPTWSPNGKQILFASNSNGPVQLYTVNLDGKGLKQISNLPAIRGRSDWSADGNYIVTYSGEPWKREIYIMNADGSNSRQLTPSGGNSQGPSFSPDGKWVVFTAYFDHPDDDHGCEIYVIHIDGTDLRRLTDNDYCDYQPRWGP